MAKVKRTDKGNVRITITEAEARNLNALLWNIRLLSAMGLYELSDELDVALGYPTRDEKAAAKSRL